jgi:hypothetical protein
LNNIRRCVPSPPAAVGANDGCGQHAGARATERLEADNRKHNDLATTTGGGELQHPSSCPTGRGVVPEAEPTANIACHQLATAGYAAHDSERGDGRTVRPHALPRLQRTGKSVATGATTATTVARTALTRWSEIKHLHQLGDSPKCRLLPCPRCHRRIAAPLLVGVLWDQVKLGWVEGRCLRKVHSDGGRANGDDGPRG